MVFISVGSRQFLILSQVIQIILFASKVLKIDLKIVILLIIPRFTYNPLQTPYLIFDQQYYLLTKCWLKFWNELWYEKILLKDFQNVRAFRAFSIDHHMQKKVFWLFYTYGFCISLMNISPKEQCRNSQNFLRQICKIFVTFRCF